MSIRTFLDLSTAHVAHETAELLNAGEGPTLHYNSEFGWLVYVGEDSNKFPDLVACFAKARELGCEYILFDCDAEARNDLPVYEW